MVFGPTPLNRDSSFFTASSSMSRKYSIHALPRSSCRVFKITWILAILISAKPPHLTAFSNGAGFDTRTLSQSGNARFKFANAIALVASVVFWDKIVPTNESRTGFKCGVVDVVSLVPCRMVYGVCFPVDGNASVELAIAVPRFPGPSWLLPSACASSLCLKNFEWSWESASRATQHSSAVGRVRVGYGESGGASEGTIDDLLFGVTGLIGFPRFTEPGVVFFFVSGLTSTHGTTVLTVVVLLDLAFLAGGVTRGDPRVRRSEGAIASASFGDGDVAQAFLKWKSSPSGRVTRKGRVNKSERNPS